MSSVLPRPLPGTAGLPWLVALAGFAAMYIPSYWVAAAGIWQRDDMGHGPIIVAVAFWLFWQARHSISSAPPQPSPALGWPLLVIGLLLYSVARTFSVSSAEFASQVFIVAGGLLLLQGPGALRAAWFPLLYLIFTVPLPASLTDAVTAPLKHWISVIVVDLLYVVGLPIARTGVTISIGPYQLLVADACSGLNSMFSLSAIGALFMFVMGRKSWLHNAIMLGAILPIAFVANIVRVVTLVLITYFLGDEAGQGFLHTVAGMLLFLVALSLLFVLDYCVAAFLHSRRHPGGSRQTGSPNG